MTTEPHIRLVPDLPKRQPSRLLTGPPWTWLGLVAATLVLPAARRVSDALSVYEYPEDDEILSPQESIGLLRSR